MSRKPLVLNGPETVNVDPQQAHSTTIRSDQKRLWPASAGVHSRVWVRCGSVVSGGYGDR